MLSSMLSRMMSMLPMSLFATLGMPRDMAMISDVKHGIDMELKCACEAVIAHCTEPLGAALCAIAPGA